MDCESCGQSVPTMLRELRNYDDNFDRIPSIIEVYLCSYCYSGQPAYKTNINVYKRRGIELTTYLKKMSLIVFS
jgi:hypothetical protein